MDGPAGAEKLAWDIPELKSDANNGYLVTLVDQAKVDGGRTLPLVDSASLATAKQEIEAGGRGLTDLAREALNGGNLDSADKLAGEALSRNPNDLAARAIKDAIAKKAGGAPAAGGGCRCGCQGGDDAPVAGGEPGDLNLQGGNAGLPPPDGAAAASEINAGQRLGRAVAEGRAEHDQQGPQPGHGRSGRGRNHDSAEDQRSDGRDRAPSGNARPLDGHAPRRGPGNQASQGGVHFTANSSGSARRWPAANRK